MNLFEALFGSGELKLAECSSCGADSVDLFMYDDELICEECLKSMDYEENESLTADQRNR